MATGTAGTTARQFHSQQTHFLRKTVNYNDTGISSGVSMGVIPAGSVIIDVVIVVTTAFNAATTNNLLVGTTAAGNDIVATADSAAGSTGLKRLASATIGTTAYRSSDQTIYVAYTQTGTAATAGKAYVIVEYVPNLDQ